MFGTATNGYNLVTSRWNTAPTMLSNLGTSNYGTAIAWSGSDTQGFLALNYENATAVIGGGNADLINWSAKLWHSLNFNPANYLPLSGGVMLGAIFLQLDTPVLRLGNGRAYDSAIAHDTAGYEVESFMTVKLGK